MCIFCFFHISGILENYPARYFKIYKYRGEIKYREVFLFVLIVEFFHEQQNGAAADRCQADRKMPYWVRSSQTSESIVAILLTVSSSWKDLQAYQVPAIHLLVGMQRCKWAKVTVQLPSLHVYEFVFPQLMLEILLELTIVFSPILHLYFFV